MLKTYLLVASLFFTVVINTSYTATPDQDELDLKPISPDEYLQSSDCNSSPVFSPEEANKFWHEIEQEIENAKRRKTIMTGLALLTPNEKLIHQLKRAYFLARRSEFDGSFEDYLKTYAPRNETELVCNFLRRLRWSEKSLRTKLSNLPSSKLPPSGIYASKLEQARQADPRRSTGLKNTPSKND